MDKRFQDNLGPTMRRRIAHATIAKRKAAQRAKRKVSKLNRAKDVLRRTGRQVFDARIDEGKTAGVMVRVDTRKMSPAAVIELAEQILEREHLRNTELRAMHGLKPAKRERL
jgi:hypothetical protein